MSQFTRQRSITTTSALTTDLAPPPGQPPRRAPTAQADEATLVRQARAGDAAAFTTLVQRYERQIYTLVYHMLGDADDAADLSQEVFVKAYRALPRISRDLRLAPWLVRIATNACLDVLRRRQRLRWLPWEGPKHDHRLLSGPADDPERQALSQETRAVVQRVLARMAPRHRLALILREIEGLSCEEIGQVLGLSQSATKSFLFRAREELRRTYRVVTDAAVSGAA